MTISLIIIILTAIALAVPFAICLCTCGKSKTDTQNTSDNKTTRIMKTLIADSRYVEGPDGTFLEKKKLNEENNPEVFYAWIRFQIENDFGTELTNAKLYVLEKLSGKYNIENYKDYLRIRTTTCLKFNFQLPSDDTKMVEIDETEEIENNDPDNEIAPSEEGPYTGPIEDIIENETELLNEEIEKDSNNDDFDTNDNLDKIIEEAKKDTKEIRSKSRSL